MTTDLQLILLYLHSEIGSLKTSNLGRMQIYHIYKAAEHCSK